MSGEENYRLYLDGDDEGLVSIIKEYRDPLTLYLAGVAGSFSLAEEFAEETFFILAAKRPRFNGKSSFKTWRKSQRYECRKEPFGFSSFQKE